MSHHHSATGGGEFADKRRGIITFFAQKSPAYPQSPHKSYDPSALICKFADKRRGIITFVRTLRVCRALLCEKCYDPSALICKFAATCCTMMMRHQILCANIARTGPPLPHTYTHTRPHWHVSLPFFLFFLYAHADSLPFPLSHVLSRSCTRVLSLTRALCLSYAHSSSRTLSIPCALSPPRSLSPAHSISRARALSLAVLTYSHYFSGR